jgi:hypothetical protein
MKIISIFACISLILGFLICTIPLRNISMEILLIGIFFIAVGLILGVIKLTKEGFIVSAVALVLCCIPIFLPTYFVGMAMGITSLFNAIREKNIAVISILCIAIIMPFTWLFLVFYLIFQIRV